MDAVVGKDTVGAHLLGQREVRGADGDRQERRDVTGDAKAVRDLNHLLDANLVSQPQRGNIARLGKGVDQRHGAAIAGLVIVRRVGAAGRGERRRRIHHRVIRLHPRLHRGGIHVGFEGRSNLPLGLRGAVELRGLEVAAAHHREHLAISIVDRHQCRLSAAVLLQEDVGRGRIGAAYHLEVHNVANLREISPLG